jgi:hypothetical protein
MIELHLTVDKEITTGNICLKFKHYLLVAQGRSPSLAGQHSNARTWLFILLFQMTWVADWFVFKSYYCHNITLIQLITPNKNFLVALYQLNVPDFQCPCTPYIFYCLCLTQLRTRGFALTCHQGQTLHSSSLLKLVPIAYTRESMSLACFLEFFIGLKDM